MTNQNTFHHASRETPGHPSGRLGLLASAGLVSGIGLGGFFDGIVLHQMLQ